MLLATGKDLSLTPNKPIITHASRLTARKAYRPL